MNFTKILHQTLAKAEGNTRSKQKLISSKKWVPSKSRKIITERNQRKRNKERNNIVKEIKALQVKRRIQNAKIRGMKRFRKIT